MGNTYRKSKGIKFKEGNPFGRTDIHYNCRCNWCTSRKKDKIETRIIEREKENQLLEWDLKFQRESA